LCEGLHGWSVASSDAESGGREMMCPICRVMLKASDAQTHLIREFSQLKQLASRYVRYLFIYYKNRTHSTYNNYRCRLLLLYKYTYHYYY